MPKVTMNLTDRDAENTASIRHATQARSNASAVSVALSLTRFIVDQMREGSELLLRTRTGEVERIIMSELANIPPASAASE
jgi:hypothetical protein